MKLYLIRHTRTSSAPGTCYGFSDVPLADTYAEEYEVIRTRAGEAGLVNPRIFSSPLKRCRRLADDLARALVSNDRQSSVAVDYDERLKEMNFGEWEGRTWDAIQTQDSERAEHWMQNFVEVACPGGESYRDLSRRTDEFLNALTASSDSLPEDDAVLLIIAHGGSIRSIVARLLGIDLERSFQLEVEFGRLTCIDWNFTAEKFMAKLCYLNR